MTAGTDSGQGTGVAPMPWPEEESDFIADRTAVASVGRWERAGRRVASILAAVLVAIFGFPIALVVLWLAAWNWESPQAPDADRRKLIAGAVAVVAATAGLMALIIWRGFRDPDR